MDYPHSSTLIYPWFCRKLLDMLHFPPLAADREKSREFISRSAENSQYLGQAEVGNKARSAFHWHGAAATPVPCKEAG